LGESDPTPGNIASGISTLAEKSLGSILKVGFDPAVKISDVLPYARPVPRGGGLYFMDTPGEDVLAITGMVAGGAHAVIFTTGLGTPVGSVVSPVVKVTANKETFSRLSGIIDVYLPVEELFSSGTSLKELAMKELYPVILEVLSGDRLTKSELNGQMDFDIRGYWLRA
jgi:Altronate dehydratase